MCELILNVIDRVFLFSEWYTQRYASLHKIKTAQCYMRKASKSIIDKRITHSFEPSVTKLQNGRHMCARVWLIVIYHDFLCLGGSEGLEQATKNRP